MDFKQKVKSLNKEELLGLLNYLKNKNTFGSFFDFCKTLVVEGKPFEAPEHYLLWEQLVNKKRVVIESARDHGKTTFWSIAYPLYKIANNPNFHVCIISYSNDQSKDILRKLRVILESTESFQDMIPTRWKPGSWGKTEIHLLNRSYVNAKSFGASMRGGHYDLVIVDDPLKDSSSMPISQQEDIFFGVISPAVKPTGQLIVVGTPVKYGDLFDVLNKNKMYESYKFPAIKEDGAALWPSRYNLETLENKRINEYAGRYWIFAREYLLQRVAAQDAPFKENWFKQYTKPPDTLYTLMSVDPAITYQGDYTGIVITGTDKDGNTYVLSTRKLRTANVNDICYTIVSMAKQWGTRRLIIEAVGFQRLLKYWLYKEMENQGYTLGIDEIKYQTASKTQRILTLQPKIEMGKLFVRPDQSDLMTEFLTFPRGTYDDLIDALSMQIDEWRKPDSVNMETPEGSWKDILEKSKVTMNQDLHEKLFADLVQTLPETDLFIK